MGKIRIGACGTRYVADYVIAGCGTSGCTMIGELSADKRTSVIGIEAGGYNIDNRPIYDSVFAGVEYGLPNNYFPEYFWQHKPVPNGSLSGLQPPHPHDTATASAINGSLIPNVQKATTVGDYTTGRLLGGGSSINGMQAVKGSPRVYEIMEKAGGKQWGPKEAYKNYAELEAYRGNTINPKSHGYTGPVSIRQAPNPATSGALQLVSAISAATGLPQIPEDDYNNPETTEGPFAKWELFQKPNGDRASAAIDFLGPDVLNKDGDGINGYRIKILFRTLTNTIIWDTSCGEPRAIGVKAVKEGQTIEVYAKKRVIVTQGVYSAEFLQRSGVGPASLLKDLGIPVILDHPNVGKNWQNQLLVPVVFTTDPAQVGVPQDDQNALYVGGAFLPPLIAGDDYKLRGYQFIGAWVKDPVKFDPKPIGITGLQPPGYLLTLLIAYLQPHSKGTIRIQSRDPATISLADNNYFGDPRDMQAFIACFQKYVVNIANQLSFQNPNYQLVQPTMDIINDTDSLTQYILNNFNHTHHWQGSNRMGSCIQDSVVNGWGEVHGVKDLIVADDSIYAVENDGNTNWPAFLSAYTISKHLKECH